MKTITMLKAAFVSASLLFFMSCSDNKNNDKVTNDFDHDRGSSTSNLDHATHDAATDANAAASERENDWRAERDQWRTETNRRIEENNAEIERARASLKEKKADARADYEKKVNDLHERNERLKTRVNEQKDDSHDAWQSFKREADHDLDEMGNAIKDLFKDNKK